MGMHLAWVASRQVCAMSDMRATLVALSHLQLNGLVRTPPLVLLLTQVLLLARTVHQHSCKCSIHCMAALITGSGGPFALSLWFKALNLTGFASQFLYSHVAAGRAITYTTAPGSLAAAATNTSSTDAAHARKASTIVVIRKASMEVLPDPAVQQAGIPDDTAAASTNSSSRAGSDFPPNQVQVSGCEIQLTVHDAGCCAWTAASACAWG